MAQKTIIKRAVRDTSRSVLLILSIMVVVVSILVSFFAVRNNNKELENFREGLRRKEEKMVDLKNKEDKILFISRLTGWRNETDWDDPKGSWTNLTDLKATLNEWASLLRKKYEIEKYIPWPEDIAEEGTEKEGRGYLTIVKLVAELEQLERDNRKSAKGLGVPRDRARSEEIEITGKLSEVNELVKKGKFVEMEEDKNREIVSLRKTTQTMWPRIKVIIEQGEEEVRQLTRQVDELSQSFIETIKVSEAEITKLEQELAEYEDRLQKLKKRVEIAREGIDIDGEIIVADIVNGYVYIDLGRQHAILEGMEFDAFDIQKGGFKQDKGRIKVIKIYENYSEASMMPKTMDTDNPIAVGNYVNSIIYNPQKAKVFTFVGRLIGRYSAAELEQQIEEFGGKVLNEITSDITYVVVGEGFETDKQYIKAVQLGALTIREKELYTFLGTEWE